MAGTFDNTSNRYHLEVFLKPEQNQKEDFVTDLLDFLKYDYEDEPTQDQTTFLMNLTKAFLVCDKSKAELGEQERLSKWISAVKDY